MSHPTTRSTAAPAPTRTSIRFLRISGVMWMSVALFGQSLFVVYLLLLYWRATLRLDLTVFSQVMPRGWVPGDVMGNTAMGAHLLLAVLIMLSGGTQVLPIVRRRWPAVHRVSGRFYLAACLLTSLAGLYLVWVRGGVGDWTMHVAITGNALILSTCCVMAWRTARARRFTVHRAWALRAFMAAAGVFFFRLFLSLWLIIHRAPVGFDPKTFSGPFLTILAFGVYVLVPLFLLELFLRAERSDHPAHRLLMATATGLTTVLTLAGVGAATVVLWLPRIAR